MARKNEIVPVNREQKSGICAYCKQIRFVMADADASPDELNELATEQCDCTAARMEQEKKQRLQSAVNWIDEVFVGEQERQKDAVKAMVKEVFSGNIRGASLRLNEKTTLRIVINSKGFLKIERIIKEQGDRQF